MFICVVQGGASGGQMKRSRRGISLSPLFMGDGPERGLRMAALSLPISRQDTTALTQLSFQQASCKRTEAVAAGRGRRDWNDSGDGDGDKKKSAPRCCSFGVIIRTWTWEAQRTAANDVS